MDWKLPGDNQRVSNSVFKVTRIIYIVRLCKLLDFWSFSVSKMAGRLYKAETSLCSEVSSERTVCDQGVDLFASSFT